MPERMILRHGFSPKRQGEVRSDLLRLAKMLGRIVVFKVVELRQPMQKVRLRRARARIHKRNFTIGLLGQRACRAQKQQRDEKQDSRNSVHCYNPFGMRSSKRGSLKCLQLFYDRKSLFDHESTPSLHPFHQMARLWTDG